MKTIKEFLESISKTGWIIVSLVAVVIILIVVGVLSVKKGVDLWPFNNGVSGFDFPEISEKDAELVALLDRSMESTNDNVLTLEDVLDGKYENDYESATVFIRNTLEVTVAVVFKGDLEIPKVAGLSCGNVTFVTTRIPRTPSIINETIKAIFADRIVTDFQPGNIIPAYHPGLAFNNAVLEGGVAKVYLRGEFTESDNSCNKDLAILQIVETVKSFDGVKSVEIYQNLQKIN